VGSHIVPYITGTAERAAWLTNNCPKGEKALWAELDSLRKPLREAVDGRLAEKEASWRLLTRTWTLNQMTAAEATETAGEILEMVGKL